MDWATYFSDSSVTLATVMEKKNNNYNLLRLVAAIFVIIGHSYAISPKDGWVDPLQQLIHFNYSGGVAVIVFFFLSGLFVTTSIQKNPNIIRFIVHRVLRIFPALIIAVLICAFVIGPIFTTLSFKDYFTNPETSSYFSHNVLLTNLQWKLPGVFTMSKYGVNGSLWTLPLEVRLYLLIALFGVFQLLRNKWVAILSFLLIMALVLVNKEALRYFSQDPDPYCLIGAFITGAICSFFKKEIIINLAGIVIVGILSLAYWNTPLRDVLFYFWLIYTLLFIFQTKTIRALSFNADYSYGVYIYGFPIQQSMNALFPGHTPLFNLLLSIPSALIMGAISWYFVEKPAISLANNTTITL